MSINLLKLLIAMYPFLKEVILYGAKTPGKKRFRTMLLILLIILIVVFVPDSIIDSSISKTVTNNQSHQYLLDNNHQMKATIATLKADVAILLSDLEHAKYVAERRTRSLTKLSLKIAKLNTRISKCSKFPDEDVELFEPTGVYDRIQEFKHKYKHE